MQDYKLNQTFKSFDSLNKNNTREILNNLNALFKQKDIQITQEDVLGSCIEAISKYKRDPWLAVIIMAFLKNTHCKIPPQSITYLLRKPISLEGNGSSYLLLLNEFKFMSFLAMSVLGAASLIKANFLVAQLFIYRKLLIKDLDLPLATYLDAAKSDFQAVSITVNHFCSFSVYKFGSPEIQRCFRETIFSKNFQSDFSVHREKQVVSPPPKKRTKIAQPNEEPIVLSPMKEKTKTSQSEGLKRFSILPAPEIPPKSLDRSSALPTKKTTAESYDSLRVLETLTPAWEPLSDRVLENMSTFTSSV